MRSLRSLVAADAAPQQDHDEVAAYFAWMDEKYQEHVVQERYNAERSFTNADSRHSE